MNTHRDPYLPSSEVCEWLLAQKWSQQAAMRVSSSDRQGEIYDCCRATAALGADECIDLVLPADGIEILRKDQQARRAVEEKQAEMEADEQRRKKERDLNRPCELGLLPMIVSKTGAGDEPEIERIICSAISGGADYLNDMPREVSLERIAPAGTFLARYLQGPLEVAPSGSSDPEPTEAW